MNKSNSDLMKTLGDSLSSKKKSKASSDRPSQGSGGGRKETSKPKSFAMYESDLAVIDQYRAVIYEETGKIVNDSMVLRVILSTATKDKKKIVQAYKNLTK